MNKTRFTNCNCHYNYETQVWICNTCENIKDNKLQKLLDFVKECSCLEDPADSFVGECDNYVHEARKLLKQIGEL